MSEPELYRMGLADGANDERVAIAERLQALLKSAETQKMSEWYLAGIASCIKVITFQPNDLTETDAE